MPAHFQLNRKMTDPNRTTIGSLFPELDRELRTLSGEFTTGILPSQTIDQFIAGGRIHAYLKIRGEQVQPASLDLRLGNVAYRVRASFLPGKQCTVASKIEKYCMHQLDLTRPAVLERGCVYIVPLIEELTLPAGYWGKANPKSSTGRLDIFTRLITDGSTAFESVPNGYRGKLYIEVVPRTFSVLVQEGTSLTQLRLIRGNPPPSDAALSALDKREPIVIGSSAEPGVAVIADGLRLSVHLSGDGPNAIVGYRARRHAPVIDVGKIGYYDAQDFWDPVFATPDRTLILDPDDFYILSSKERIRVPPSFSASMVAYDPSVGEFRIHYAGFFDPGFGCGSQGANGAKAVLEVRSHEVPFLLEDGQIVGRLIYERMLEPPSKTYSVGIGSSYQSQGLALSKHFRGANPQ